MGSDQQESSTKPQSPEITAMKDESHGTKLPDEGVVEPPQTKAQSVAIGLARNGVAVLLLIAVIVIGTASMSRNYNARPMEQVVNLGNTLDQKYPSGTSKTSLSGRHEQSPQQKARARHHRRIKSQSHPDNIGHAGASRESTRRLMMGKGMGMGGGISRSGSGRSGRTFMPTPQPSASPSASPTFISASPSRFPSPTPTVAPTTLAPSVSSAPSQVPSTSPSLSPSVSFQPSLSQEPSMAPSVSKEPSMTPSISPSGAPSVSDPPSIVPTNAPVTEQPSANPSILPTFVRRTFPPTVAPTDGPGRPAFGSSRSRSRSGGGGMMGMGRGRARAFEIDDDGFDDQLNDLLEFLPADFAALFANGNN